MLFDRIREVVTTGTSVIYITHRLAELRQIAQRVTVLRDGRVQGVGLVNEVSDAELLSMIVGRTLGLTFPQKSRNVSKDINFAVELLSGKRFTDVSFDVSRGQIVGVAGVAGNGQSELMRALAGLQQSKGAIQLDGRALDHGDLLREAAFMPSDRHTEGLAASLTVRENATFAALDRFAAYGLLSRKREVEQVRTTFNSLAVKTASLEAPILSLSGGNQQKVVMARALLSEPKIIVADEPTQGVDVGARAEIYRILREVSSSGTPVIVNSSDAAELEGLCDQVIVMSRGRVVAKLSGDEVLEARIVAAAVKADTHVGDFGVQDRVASGKQRMAALSAIGQRASRSPGSGHQSARALRFRPKPQLSIGVQYLQHPPVGDRVGLHRARANRRAADGWDRLVGGPARGFSGRGRLVLRERWQVSVGDRRRLPLNVRRRVRRRRDQRTSHKICEFHCDRRDAGDVYRPSGDELPVA